MGAKARLLKRDGKTNEAKQIQDQIQQFESKIEEDNKKEQDEKIKVNNIVDKIEKGELIPLDDIEFYEANKNKIDKAIQARQLETELSAPSVIMPEENVAPEIIEPTRPAVIMPEENVPVETTVVRPEQQGKAPSVIMPEANVAPKVAETVVTEEVAPTEVKPEVKSKLESFKTKFAPQPKELSMKGTIGTYWKAFIIIRSALVSAILVFLTDHPEFQIITNLILSGIFTGMMLINPPYDSPSQNKIHLYNELMTSAYLYTLFAMTDYNQIPDSKETFGIILFGIVVVSIIINILILIINLIIRSY
jgi:hypothetical protein